ncbi:MAG: ribonuclease HII [Clostridia bacterium]|nr:ribonuclease HII [Clostridia bacterium]
MWEFEEKAKNNGYNIICGVDEAGRGPLAGPVFAAAVILPYNIEIEGLNDSKKVSEKKREALFDIICERAIAFGIASCDEKEIDDINILNASMLAMSRAVEKLSVKPEIALIDGNKTPKLDMPAVAIVKGDAKSASIAAASILAKVSRDRFMLKLAEEYPQYEFEKHKGYPTKLHYDKIREFGVSPIHRMTFLRKFFAQGE